MITPFELEQANNLANKSFKSLVRHLKNCNTCRKLLRRVFNEAKVPLTELPETVAALREKVRKALEIVEKRTEMVDENVVSLVE